jgi:hypothetical protein
LVPCCFCFFFLWINIFSVFVSYFIVLDAGHMVPMDLPEIALKMISTFISKGTFRTGESKLGVSYKLPVPGSVTENRNRHLAALSSKEESKKEGRKSRYSGTETTSVSVSSGSSHHYYPTIAYSSALQTSVYLRLRLQHSLRSTSVHHSNPNTLMFTPSNKKNSTSWSADKDLTISLRHDYVLRIDPGAKALKIEETWFNKSNLHADLIIEGLIPGIEYSFVIQHNVTTNGLHHVTGGLGTRRVIVAKPGCYHAKFSQCCEHGECSVNEENPANEPFCQCDAGYYGTNCDLYNVIAHSSPSSSTTASVKASNLTSNVVCPSRVTIPYSSTKISILGFTSVDEMRDGKIVNLKPCSTNATTKCCVSIELLVKLSEEMIDTPLKSLESLIANDFKNAVNFIVGYKNLIATDVTMGSEPSIPKLLKGNKHPRSGMTGGEGSGTTSHPHASSSRHHTNITINRQMPLVLSMCGSPTLVNKVYRDLEMQVKDPTSLVNQDVSWRLSSHYYRLVSQKSFSPNEMSSYRGDSTTSSSSSSSTSSSSNSESSHSPQGSSTVTVTTDTTKDSDVTQQKPSKGKKKGKFSLFSG